MINRTRIKINKMKEIDKQQKQSGMTAEELLFELDQLRIKYKGYKTDIEESNPRIDKSINLINQFKKEVEEKRCKECTFSFIKGGGGYHDVEDFYKE